LDDEIALAQLTEVGYGAHPAEDRFALGAFELAAVGLLRKRLLQACDHRVGGALGPAAQDDLEAGFGCDLGDARTHDPRTHDPDALDRHHSRSCSVGSRVKAERLPATRRARRVARVS